MIAYLGLGLLLLVLLLWLVRLFLAADPAKLARGLGGSLFIVIGVLLAAVVLIGVAAEEPRLVTLGVGGLGAVWLGARRRRLRRQPASSPTGRISEVETEYIRMRLDHDSGTMSGTVRRGPLQGCRLAALSRAELIGLWRQCRSEDEQGANLLEAYLDRFMPGWREAESAAAGEPGTAGGKGTAMTREEAYAVLGLAPGAAEAEIREAYRRLMLKIHPDHGGSSYLAAAINRAREVLLGSGGS